MAGVALLTEVGKGFMMDEAKTLLGKVTDLLKEQIVLAWGFRNDLENFKDKLATIQLMVGNAANIDNPVLEGWLNKVKDLIILAEDVVDEYEYEMLRRKVITNRYQHPSPRQIQHHSRSRCRCFPCVFLLWTKIKVYLAIFKSWSSNPVVFRIRMANKVKSLRKTWDEIMDLANKLGIKLVKVAVAAPDYQEPETLRNKRNEVDVGGIVGRDTEMKTIINLLRYASNSSQCLSVIGICGATGLGKTTLCRATIDSNELDKMFQHRIFICVSHAVQLDKLLNEIAEQMKVPISSSREALKRDIKEKLKDKKYLLVLDDIWDSFLEEWESLSNMMIYLKGCNGNTLLVTSRSKDVLEKLTYNDSDGAGRLKDPHIYELEKLTEDKSTELFWQRVGCEESSDHLKKNVAERLLDRCNGVPLAIRTLGDTLRSQKHGNDWVKIEKSEIWKEKGYIYPSVKLSFMFLSSASVKRCFALCGYFKKDEVIVKDKLIHLWMANGLLQSPNNDKMEHIGEQYFDELLGNSLFQEVEFNGGPLRKLISCKMHDVVHELASDILKKEPSCSSFLQIQYHLSPSVNDDDDDYDDGDDDDDDGDDGGDGDGDDGGDGDGDGDDGGDGDGDDGDGCSGGGDSGGSGGGGGGVCGGDELLKRTLDQGGYKSRMLVLSGRCEQWDKKVRLFDFKCLRALSLVAVLKELPDSIGMLIHLRYLDISINHALGCLPDGLTKLHHLQTLRMLIMYIPRFPREINELVNLRHLCCDDRESVKIGIPKGLGMLSCLQTLPWLDLKEDWGGRLGELKSLNQLKGKISLKNLQMANEEEARDANLKSKENIEYLVLSWDDDNDGENNTREEDHKKVLNALQPHPNLWGLVIRGYKAKTLSEWVLGPNSHSLSCLTIENCKYITCLSNVRDLTYLEILSFTRCYNVSRLKQSASIFDLPKLRELVLGPFSPKLDTVFPPHPDPLTTPLSKSLCKLRLCGYGMVNVKTIPSQIQYLISLTCLEIESFHCVEEIPEWLSKLTSLKQLYLYGMRILKRLPSANAMKQLSKLDIWNCWILEEECAKGEGRQWPNIQHIPIVNIY